MQKKITAFLSACGSLSMLLNSPISADDDQDKRRNYRTDTYNEEREDTWYGSGYYYGYWFDDEEEYWTWRSNHPGYPSNRGYYNREHPIPYHQEGERGDQGPARNEGRDNGAPRGGGARGGR
jgi:hypothetical protein